MELNLNQRNIPMDKIQKRSREKWDHLFVFSADDSKKPVTVWAKYLSASERSHLAFLANAMNC